MIDDTLTKHVRAATELLELIVADRALLDVIGVVGFQNMESRLRLALGDA